MQSGRKGIGSHKHGISGNSPKSPKFKMRMKLEAEKNERKRKPAKMYNSMQELLNEGR